jgi:hypothetical protein
VRIFSGFGYLAVSIFMVYTVYVNVKVKHSRYRPMGPRGFWEVKVSRFRDTGTLW